MIWFEPHEWEMCGMWSYINHICNLVNHHEFDIRKKVCRKEHELYENLVNHHEFDIKKGL
jgi:hypothetical protein